MDLTEIYDHIKILWLYVVCSRSRRYWFTVPGHLNPACTLGLRFAATVYSYCFHGWKLRLLSLLLSHIPGSPHIAQTDKERLQRLCLPTCCWRGWWKSRAVEGWDLMHNEMGFNQRKRGEKKPVDKPFAFLLLPADYSKMQESIAPMWRWHGGLHSQLCPWWSPVTCSLVFALLIFLPNSASPRLHLTATTLTRKICVQSIVSQLFMAMHKLVISSLKALVPTPSLQFLN